MAIVLLTDGYCIINVLLTPMPLPGYMSQAIRYFICANFSCFFDKNANKGEKERIGGEQLLAGCARLPLNG